uniref:Relaxin-3 n=1 Tax=Denticeps clupeoides TaxID=299321 RepID=A0AAY4AU19_9TELE
MWKAVGLCICLLVAGVRTMDSPTYGVKLCGREFIRAVIFTCGGSRWRRSLRSLDIQQDALSSKDAADPWISDPIPELPFAHNVESANILGWSMEHQDEGVGMFSRPARSLITEEILEALRTSDRKGRDVVVGLSNACCKWGCSKSEISSLC